MCVFCDEFEKGSARIIWEDDDWIVIPGLGSFVPGYCLLLPKNCYRSFSHLPAGELAATENIAESIRRTISRHFGPTAIAEHGIAKNFGHAGSACCADHAHLHFLPIPDPLRMLQLYERAGGVPARIQEYNELARIESAYLFLSPIPGTKLCWPWKLRFTKQFARRVAASLNHEERWDWQTDYFEGNMNKTIKLLRPIPIPWRNGRP